MDLEATLTPRRRIAVNLRANLAANAAHCERQITETYKTEELLHGLWKQKQMKERGVVLGTFSERQQVRLRAERELGSTYLLGKDAARRAAARLAAELAEAEPRFADVDALRDFGRFAARRSRALPDDGVVVSAPATPRDLRATIRAPPLGSLMSPRFNVDYRVAARDALLPPSPRRVQPMGLEALLRLIAALCDEKLKADERAEATNTPLPPLLDLLHERIVRSHGLRSIADRKVAALREACATHGGHARIPLFSKIAHLDATDDDAWAEYKAHAAAALLQLGLRLAAPPPPGPPLSPGAAGFSVGRRIELTANHKGVSVVESHSRRADDGTAHATELPLAAVAILLDAATEQKVLPKRGKFARDPQDILGDAAAALELPQRMPPLPRRKEPAVDLDVVVMRWIELWDSWVESFKA